MIQDRKKSEKVIVPLENIVQPYRYTPEENIEGGVAGKMFMFAKGFEVLLDYPQFEVLLNAGKIKI